MQSVSMVPSFLPMLITATLLFPLVAEAWDGYDQDTGQYIEIKNDEDLIAGTDIEFYDYRDNKYHDGNIVSVTRGGSIEVEIYDYDRKEYRTFVFDETAPTKQRCAMKICIIPILNKR